jgi:hypothetical protein
LSASQLDTFSNVCQRKWGWRYIAGIKPEQSASGALGDKVEAQLQRYLCGEITAFDYTTEEGQIAGSALEHLPKPNTPGMVLQRDFKLPSPTRKGEILYVGRMDVGLSGEVPTVIDFKTTRDIGQWAKSPADLATDPQSAIYAVASLYENRKATGTDNVWIYMQTRGTRKSKRVHLHVNADAAVARFRELDVTGGRMLELKRSVRDVLQLPFNASACDAYGGCPYRDKCNLAPGDFLGAQFDRFEDKEITAMGETLSTVERLKARKAAQAAGGAGPVASAPTASATAPTHAPAAAGAAPAPSSPPPKVEGVTFSESWKNATDPSDPPIGINPPESKLVEQENVPSGTAPAIGTPLTEEPKKRGRKPKVEDTPMPAVLDPSLAAARQIESAGGITFNVTLDARCIAALAAALKAAL